MHPFSLHYSEIASNVVGMQSRRSNSAKCIYSAKYDKVYETSPTNIREWIINKYIPKIN